MSIFICVQKGQNNYRMEEFDTLIKTLQAALDKSTTGSQSRRDAVKRDLDNLVRSNALSTEELKNRNKALNAARDLIKSDEELKEKLDDRIKQNNEINVKSLKLFLSLKIKSFLKTNDSK